MDEGLKIDGQLLLYLSQIEGPALRRMLEGFLDSPAFLNCSFDELLRHVKNDSFSVDEFRFFNALIKWARTKCVDPENISEMKRIFEPVQNQEDLLAYIRIPLFGQENWNRIRKSKEIYLIPLRLLDIYDDYFDSDENKKKKAKDELMLNLRINFQPRGHLQDADANRRLITTSNTAVPVLIGSETNGDDPVATLSNTTPRKNKRRNATEPSISNHAPKRSTRGRPKKQKETNSVSKIVKQERAKSSSETEPSERMNLQCIELSSDDDDYDLFSKVPVIVSTESRLAADSIPSSSAAQTSTSRLRILSNGNGELGSVANANENQNETTNEIHYKNITYSFATYFQSIILNSQPNLQTEICVQFNVNDHMEGVKLFSRPTFPNLKEFHLNFMFKQSDPEGNELFNRFKEFALNKIELKSFIFFDKRDNHNWGLDDLWNLDVNLSLKFHGCTILQINHPRKEFILNGCRNKNEIILNCLEDIPLKKLALGRCKLPEKEQSKISFKHVEILVLYGVHGGIPFNEILHQCTSLTELTMWKNDAIETESKKYEPINLNNIRNRNKLQRLALCRSILDMGVSGPFVNLHTLHINNCVVAKEFEEGFTNLFPNVNKLSLGDLKIEQLSGPAKPINLKLVVAVLKMPSLEWVRVLKMCWKSAKNTIQLLTEFEHLTGRKKTKSSLILEKRPKEKWPWKIVKELDENEMVADDVPGGYHDTVDEQEWEFYQLQNFYSDFSSTIPGWLTFSAFHLGFD